MAKSTKDAGLSTDGTVASMSKLMEEGKLLSHEVLPFFAKNMREAANANGALDTALDKNLNPALGRTLLTLQDLSNEVFKGLKPSVMFALDGFNELGEDTRALAQAIGSALGGALLVVTAPIKLVTSLFLDLRYIIKDTFDITDEAETKAFKFVGTLMGMVGALALIVKWSKLARTGLGLVSGAIGVGGATTAATTAASSAKAGTVAGAVIKGAARGVLSANPAGLGLAALSATKQYEASSLQQSRHFNVQPPVRNATADAMNQAFAPQRLEHTHTIKLEGNQNLVDLVDSVSTTKSEKALIDQFNSAYMNLNGQ